jgi:hypothetical protein
MLNFFGNSYLILILFFLNIDSQVYAQNNFSLGMGGGIGGSIPSPNAKFDLYGITYALEPNMYFGTAGTLQYLIGNVIGVESGLNISIQTYRLQKGRTSASTLVRVIRNESEAMIFDCQIPLVLVYKMTPSKNPFRFIKFFAGTSVDWISTDIITRMGPLRSLNKLTAGIRIGKALLVSNAVEFGIEYQYSFEPIFFQETNYAMEYSKFESRISVLTFNFYFYLGDIFPSRNRGNT